MAIGNRVYWRRKPPCPLAFLLPPQRHVTTRWWAEAIKHGSCSLRTRGALHWRIHRRCLSHAVERQPHRCQVLSPVGCMNLQPIQIHILDPQAQRLHQARSGAVPQTREQLAHVIQRRRHRRAHFISGENYQNPRAAYPPALPPRARATAPRGLPIRKRIAASAWFLSGGDTLARRAGADVNVLTAFLSENGILQDSLLNVGGLTEVLTRQPMVSGRRQVPLVAQQCLWLPQGLSRIRIGI